MAFVQHLFPHSVGVELLSTASTNVTQLVNQHAPHEDGVHCSEGTNFSFWLGWFLFAAQLPLCYIPQYVKLWQAGTHIGLSLPNTICFSFTAFLQFLTFVCQQFHDIFDCCMPGTNGWQCGFAMAPFLQTVTAWFGSAYTIHIFFQVFDRPGLEAKNYDPDDEHAACMRQVYATVFLHGVLIGIPLVLWLLDGAVDSPRIKHYGAFATIACSVLIASHWFLQMHETWRMQGIGSLSMTTLVFASVGSGISALNFLSHGGIMVAFPFVVGFVAILMAMFFALWVDYRAKKGLSPEWSSPPPPLDAVSIAQSFTGSQPAQPHGEGVEMPARKSTGIEYL